MAMERPSVIVSNPRRRSGVITSPLKWQPIASHFEGKILRAIIVNDANFMDPILFLEEAKILFLENLIPFLARFDNAKIFCSLETEFFVEKRVGSDEIQIDAQAIYLTIDQSEVVNCNDHLGEWFTVNVLQCIATKFTEFSERESGKMLNKIIGLHVHMHAFEPYRRGSRFIRLPLSIVRKRAVVNVQNDDDDKCFVWSLAAALFHQRNPSRTTNVGRTFLYRAIFEELQQNLNLGGISFPLSVHQVALFERQNPQFSFNVYTLEKSDGAWEVRGPLHYTRRKREQHFNFLLHSTAAGDSHYCWIRHFSRLVRSQISSHHGALHACDRCLQMFTTEERLRSHVEDCANVTSAKVVLPPIGGNILKFTDFQKQLTVPFTVYVDFEAFPVPIASCAPSNATSFTLAYQLHTPFAVGIQLVCSFDATRNRYLSYVGEGCGDWLLDQLVNVAGEYENLLENPAPLVMTEADEIAFRNATTCHICGRPVGNEEGVRDHDHFTSIFRGKAHASCNVNYRVSSFIPIFAHNSANYDSHFILVALSRKGNLFQNLRVIPSNHEKFIAFSATVGKVTLRFLDSMKFLQSSLDELSNTLLSDDLKFIRGAFDDERLFNLAKRKGVFPYDYLTDFSKLQETSLPAKDKFYSRLYNAHISDSEYTHAQDVWRTFAIRDMCEYTKLYLKIDVLLLTDIFERFRNLCRVVYHLDPCHFFTTPGLSWAAMLKMTNVSLELLTDVDMLLLFERGTRGGLCQLTQRHGRANNRYMGETYDTRQPDVFLLYLDVCNLYGRAQSLPLPTGDFKWVEPDHIQNFNLKMADEQVDRGYVLEVDLDFPDAIHDDLRDLPPLPENIIPPQTASRQKKLIASLFPKRKYVLHLKNLIQALELGVQLVKIHRGISFRQSSWLADYMNLNTTHRQSANSLFEQNFFKLQNNAIYGKSMENVRLYKRIYLVNAWNGRYGARRLIADPAFITTRPIEGDLMTIQLRKTEVKMFKPIYLGQLILDYSKFHMYNFFYSFLVKKLENLKLLYIDTDSFIISSKTDVYAVMRENGDVFDTSNYPLPNRFNITPRNKKVIGLWKDECGGDVLVEFVGLRSKMYAYLTLNKCTSSKAKGVQRSIVRNYSFDDYRKCLFGDEGEVNDPSTSSSSSCRYDLQHTLRSRQHKIFSLEMNKKSLSVGDDKRFWIDVFTSLPWGHFRTRRDEIDSEESTGTNIENAACTS